MRRAYEMCDGTRTFRDVSAAADVPFGTISGWSRRWRDAGLAYENDDGRIAHLVSLEAVGIPLEGDRGPTVARSTRRVKGAD
jgi:hypothetical protein